MSVILALVPILQGLFIIQIWSSISYFSISLIVSTFILLCYVALSNRYNQFSYEHILSKLLICIPVAYLILIYNNPLLSIIILFTVPFLLVNRNLIKFEIVDDIFFIFALVSFLFYLLAEISVIDGIPVTTGNRAYYLYIFTLSDFDISNSTNLQSNRFYGFCHEPGAMGLFLGFSLLLRKDVSHFRSILVIILGILTFSTIFFYFFFIFLLYHCYYLRRLNTLFKISAFVVPIAVFIFLVRMQLSSYPDGNFYEFLIYKINIFSISNVDRRLNTEDFFQLVSQFSLSQHLFGANQSIDFDSSLLSLYTKLGMLGVLAYFILLSYFWRIWYILLPLTLVRYNFIFSEFIYIASLSIYIKNIKHKSIGAS